MPNITYVPFEDEPRIVNVKTGDSAMNGARGNNIPGIEADCRGSCVSAICHVYVDTGWIDKRPRPGSEKDAIRDFKIDHDPERSRLSCQIPVTDEMDGPIVHLSKELAETTCFPAM